MGGLVEKIIPRNSTIPIARAQEFTTYKDGQTAMAIQVVQGERELVADCRSLAKFELRGIPPMVAGTARIRVTFQVDADGLLSVNAQETSHGVQAHVTVKPSYGVTDEDISRMLQDSFAYATDDMQARALREQQVDARQLIEAVQIALQQDGELVDEGELATIDHAINELKQTLESQDHRAIKLAIEALNRITEPFAARRMDKSVSNALRGRKLSQIEG
jgi:molecular chaperone HscA